MKSRDTTCAGIVPPYLLQHLVDAGGDLADHARRTLVHDALLRARPTRPTGPAAIGGAGLRRTIHDAHQGTTLPGDVVREEGGAPAGDDAVNQAYDGLGDTWALFKEVFGRDSIDGN